MTIPETPILLGKPIKSVFFLGKISYAPWRDLIIPDWSQSMNEWEKETYCLTPSGFPLKYTGPFWTNTTTIYNYNNEPWLGRLSKPECHSLVKKICKGMLDADLIFTWIDSLDCFGTLVELGYAKAFNKTIAVYVPEGFDASQLWLGISTANIFGQAANAKDAWYHLFSLFSNEGNL